MIVNVTFFDKCRDNNAGSCVVDLEWNELKEIMLTEHNIVTEKDGAMFNGMKFEDRRGEGWIRRCRDNVSGITLLILDYDGKEKIEDIKERFKHYEYVGYTSFSHKTKEKDGRDCFRIVLPLLKEVTLEEMIERRVEIRKWAGDIDESSTDISRGFYLPACLEESIENAERWSNDGYIIDVMEFDKTVVVMNDSYDSVECDDYYRSLFKKELMDICLNAEPMWMRVMWAMKAMGFDENDFIDVTVNGNLMNAKSIKDCKEKWSKSSNIEINAGFLINLIRGNGNMLFLKDKKFVEMGRQIFELELKMKKSRKK